MGYVYIIMAQANISCGEYKPFEHNIEIWKISKLPNVIRGELWFWLELRFYINKILQYVDDNQRSSKDI